MKKRNEGVIWETITVRMTQEEKETLRKIAEEEDLTLTIYVKRLLRREIRRAQASDPGPLVDYADALRLTGGGGTHEDDPSR